jgi:hypothetical protein
MNYAYDKPVAFDRRNRLLAALKAAETAGNTILVEALREALAKEKNHWNP